MSVASYADVGWMSATFDNDLFVGNDNGYTNGLYLSVFDVGDSSHNKPAYDFWVKPLMSTMPKHRIQETINAYTLGQTMSTPNDINIVIPDNNELPYSALLALTNSYVTVKPLYADRVSTSIGIVGPAAFGEGAQKFVHKVISADKPQGWDTQLKNELVFQFSRARMWRAWQSDSGHFDFLRNADLSLGTIQSAASVGMILRYGRGLRSSYATTLFNRSRTINPSAVNGGWYFYGGVQAGYLFNQIFADGNTFRNSRSIDYDHKFIGLAAGLAYSWHNYSLTIAVNDANILQSGGGEETLKKLTQYGTMTFAWRR